AVALDFSVAFVHRALDDDARAARELVAAIVPLVHSRVVRMLLRFRAASRHRDVRQEGEDLTQDVLLSRLADRGRALRAWPPERGRTLPQFVGLLAEREVYSIL